MPREIITIQIGQCGNQSKIFFTKSVPNSGSSSVDSTESAQAASSKNTHQTTTELKTAKTSFSTRQTTTTTSLDQF